MSEAAPEENQVTILLALLERSKDLVAQAYYQGRIEKTPATAGKINALRVRRLMSPDVRDMFSLHTSLRHFLNTVLSTERLIRPGTDFGYAFDSLIEAAKLYEIAYSENRMSDCERYEFEIREAICGIADAMDAELLDLRTKVASRFAAVTTIAEKRSQNIFYQERTKKIVDTLEAFHFSDLTGLLSGSSDLTESYRSLWLDRLPIFRESLLDILGTLRRYLYEYREIEDKARLVRNFAQHLARHPDWTMTNWAEAPEIPTWLNVATGIALAAQPDVNRPETESMLVELAHLIPAAAAPRKEMREVGKLQAEEPAAPIRLTPPVTQRALKEFVAGGVNSTAKTYWQGHGELNAEVPLDVWLLCALYHLDKTLKTSQFVITPDAAECRWGNQRVRDIHLVGNQPGAGSG